MVVTRSAARNYRFTLFPIRGTYRLTLELFCTLTHPHMHTHANVYNYVKQLVDYRRNFIAKEKKYITTRKRLYTAATLRERGVRLYILFILYTHTYYT